jgi:hypothetical protein
MSRPSRHDPYASLRIRNFRWFITSLLAMTVATQIQAVVVAWQTERPSLCKRGRWIVIFIFRN